MQSLLNNTLRWVNGDRFPYNTTVEALHTKYKMSPLNVRLYEQNEKLWERIAQLHPEKYLQLMDNRQNSHAWWPSTRINENIPPPAPIFVKERRDRRQIMEEETDSEER